MNSIVKYKFALLALVGILFAACDESTGTLGIPVESDIISNSTANFPVYTRSIRLDSSIVANTMYSYIGHVVDPETGCVIDADFVAQYQNFEDYDFPKKENMIFEQDSDHIYHGIPTCDSIEVRLYYTSYYGDGNNPMKIEVFEMSDEPDKILCEDSTYYTDININNFLPSNAKAVASRMFTATNYDLCEEDREDDDYQVNIPIKLPTYIGQRIIDKYYEDRANFKDNYSFTHHVLPGLYFRCSNGTGTMLTLNAGFINVFFKYYDEKKDTIYSAVSRFAATPEVIQCTRIQNSDNMNDLVKETQHTYLKTPAGIVTEVTLPIKEVFEGEHAVDSVSKASITFTRYNKEQNKYQLSTPSELLMVRKSEMYSFFRNRETPNSRTNFYGSFSSTYNSYSFTNISRLMSYCQHEKIDAIRKRLADKGYADYTISQYETEESLWEAENPDWNKVVLIPITTTSTTSNSTTVITSVNHDMNLNSIRLVGGDTPLEMQVFYSRFHE